MADFPSVCVLDSNVLIDLHKGELLSEFFAFLSDWSQQMSSSLS